MKVFNKIFFGLGMLAVLFSANAQASQQALIDSVKVFSNKLSPYISAGKVGENVFFSNYNIQTAFQLLYPATVDPTRKEMGEVLGIPGWSNDDIYTNYSFLAGSLENTTRLIGPNAGKETKIRVGTQLWANSNTNFEFHLSYKEPSQKYFGSTVETIDFSAAKVTRREEDVRSDTKYPELKEGTPVDVINSAVAYDTDGMITGLLKEINPKFPAILIATLLIDGNWAAGFSKALTHKSGETGGFFQDIDGNHLEHDIMHQKASMEYYRGSNFQTVRKLTLDNGAAVEFYITDSSEKSDVEAFRNEFLASDAVYAENDYQNRAIDLKLPRFKAGFRKDITGDMAQLMPATFSGGIPNMGNDSLAIGQVIHMTALEVHEFGFRAAAATAIMMRSTGIAVLPTYYPVKIDRPFGIRIIHGVTGIELFKGWIAVPEKMDPPKDQ